MAESQSVDVGRAFRILWANAWIVLIVVAAAAGGTYAWSNRQSKVYEATALVRAFDAAAANGASGGSKADPARAVDIQVLYAKSQDVVTQYQKQIGSQLAKIKSTTISAVTDADAISIVVDASSRTAAQAGAQTYAQAYIERQRASLGKIFSAQSTALRARAADAQKQLSALDAQIAKLQPTEGSRVDIKDGKPVVVPATERLHNLSLQRNTLGSKYASLLDQADRILATGATQQADVDFVQRPALPGDAVSPRPKQDALVAGLIGLLLGLGLVVLRNRVRGRLVTTDDVKAVAPAIGFVSAVPPNGSHGRRAGIPQLDAISTEDGRLAESYRSMAAWLRLARSSRTARSQIVLVTSANAAEGKTSVSTNLAVSLALSGERVVVVDCDLRHPTVHSVFRVPEALGYSSVVLKTTALHRALERVTLAGGSLDVLPAGGLADSPAQLLASRGADQLWAELRSRYDYIIVDSSPVLPVADALTLSRVVDQVLLTVRAGRTRNADLAKAIELLQQFGAQLGGAALIGAKHETVNSSYAYPMEARSRSGKRKHGAPSGRSNGRVAVLEPATRAPVDEPPQLPADLPTTQFPAIQAPTQALSHAPSQAPAETAAEQTGPLYLPPPTEMPPPPPPPTEMPPPQQQPGQAPPAREEPHLNGSAEQSGASVPNNTSP